VVDAGIRQINYPQVCSTSLSWLQNSLRHYEGRLVIAKNSGITSLQYVSVAMTNVNNREKFARPDFTIDRQVYIFVYSD
jgi:hypothetical protein